MLLKHAGTSMSMCNLLNLIQCSLYYRFSTASLHKVGCADALKNFLSRKSGALGGMAMGVACFQITIIVGASILVRKWSNSPDHCYPCY